VTHAACIVMKRTPVRVESQRSLRSREAILDVVHGVARARDVPVLRSDYESITEVPVDELVEYVTETVQRRLSVRTMRL
jgi:hypothetical protein